MRHSRIHIGAVRHAFFIWCQMFVRPTLTPFTVHVTPDEWRVIAQEFEEKLNAPHTVAALVDLKLLCPFGHFIHLVRPCAPC